MEDLPMILNSISWQLKRIADHMDKDSVEQPPIDFPMKPKKTASVSDLIRNNEMKDQVRDIREIFKNLDPKKD